MKITKNNIDDHMRELLKKGRKTVRWSKSEWKIIEDYIWACTCGVFSGKGGYRIKEGDLFMGLRHYKIRQRKQNAQ